MTGVIIVGVIGLVCSVLLVVASHFLSVPADTRVEDIRAFLPGANCGACGYAGCDDYAKAVAGGSAKPNLCIPGGASAADQISEYLGVAAESTMPQKAVVRCSGTCEKCGDAEEYHGPATCAACAALYRGKKACSYGCMGYGDCVKVCKFGALSIVDGVALVDESLCTGCGACAKACPHLIIGMVPVSSSVTVRCSSHDSGAVVRKVCSAGCIGCMMCTKVCPTGAITVKNDIGAAWRALHDPQKRVVIQIAPAVRVAIGEAYGLPAGENVLDKLVTALKIMGADEIYDTIFGADLTVREESKEFLRRLETGENLPLMTSCCPSWVRYVEQERPQFIKNLSSALSPMQMFATVLKDKYREKDAADGRTTFHIAIMPCTAKKMEAGREEFRRDGVPNVDLVLTTQEVIKMIKESGIRFQMLEKESPDLPFGMGSGAAEIFGTSGGVAEAVLRCCLPDKSKNVLRMLEHSGLRGTEAVRFVTIPVNGRDVRVALAHGLANAAKLLDQIENGEVEVDLVEVMSCRTGCVGGAGQPYALMSTKLKRAHGLYEIDRSAMFKRSERNPVLDAMYAAGLNERAHELLHHEYKD